MRSSTGPAFSRGFITHRVEIQTGDLSGE
jgi:hypothetical protein